jgi:predicted RNA-binding protein with PUA-like domain
MNYWLFKSEPSTYPWSQMISDDITSWDGVRNYQAASNMKKMRIDDLGFFYHSVKEKSIVGVVKVVKEYYPDHTDETGRFGMVDIQALAPTQQIITLADIKNTQALQDLPLVKQSRLSVSPIPADSWSYLCTMAGVSQFCHEA